MTVAGEALFGCVSVVFGGGLFRCDQAVQPTQCLRRSDVWRRIPPVRKCQDDRSRWNSIDAPAMSRGERMASRPEDEDPPDATG